MAVMVPDRRVGRQHGSRSGQSSRIPWYRSCRSGPMRAASRDVVILGERRRRRLEAIVAKQTAPQRLVLRAKIVLAAWRGHSNAEIARDLGVSITTVRTWRRRFCAEG